MTGAPLTADLVLEGGGVLGIAHVGVLSVLEGAGYHFARVAGASVGSIVGALVAAEMPSARMEEVLRGLDYRSFADRGLLDRIPIAGPALSLLRDNGLYEGDQMREWLGKLLAEQGIETFGQLRITDPRTSLPPERRYRLCVIATDVTRGELVHLPWDYGSRYGLRADEILIVDAVRASMSIPFLYEPVELKHGDGELSTLVDGGVLSNFPIDIFDRTDGVAPRWPTFGIKLIPRLPMDAGQLLPGLGLIERGPIKLASDLVMTAIVGRDQAHLAQPWVAARTIEVDTAGVSPIDFGLTQAAADTLLRNGQAAARAFLDGWDWEEYLAKFRQSR
jgi:NTE family protein